MGDSSATNGIREIPFVELQSPGSKFPSNTVCTSKYTVITFVPINLYEQFNKAANVYFLFISAVLFIGEQTFNGKSLYKESIKAYSTFLTLAVMMAASAVMAAIDDFKRHKSDAQMNAQPASKVSGSDVVKTTWHEVKVGEILIIRSEEELPADVVPLACSGDEGTCYVSTANLDGETNLKTKVAVSSTQCTLCGERETAEGTGEPLLNRVVKELKRISGNVMAEKPQCSIHNFEGKLSLNGSSDVSLSSKHLLLRGTMLRNTAWCVGIVVYTGPDTRVVMNSRKTPLKVSNLERVVNYSMLVILAAQATLALVSDIMFNSQRDQFKGYWYLYPGGLDKGIILPEFIGYWITFFGLYSNLMPISLYATIEICNGAQAFFLKSDLQMYDKEFDCSAILRTTNLVQELGQVRYIFSDKTGTLTQNVMELKRVWIAGQVFGQVGPEKGFQGGPAVMEARQRHSSMNDAIYAFFEVLAVSHTVVVTEDHHGKIRYEAESPDEDALVSAAASLGWSFQGRVGQKMTVQVSMKSQTEQRTYTVMALNAFTSARKRMSVLVQRDSGEYELLVKGADNMMLERADDGSYGPLENQLTDFAREGLRTLVIGKRTLSKEEALAWQQEYETAQCALEDRNGALAAVAEKAEKQLKLLGATAIEDKFQEGVGQTIVRLRRAGVKLWVLTGDKLETARNIGYSTRVLSDEMDILKLDVDNELGPLESQLPNALKRVEKAKTTGVVAGLMVTGLALESFIGSESEPLFLEIAQQCSVVIACRVSPLQKAQMVGLVRKRVKPQPVTLAVGDGANDVPMIQEAQVGVGIVGREGRQAVNSADFAIAQFRFLQRLLLVHGRFNYLRACKFILYTFWRNAVQVLLMFYYSFVSGNSGVSLFEDKVRMTFNMFLSLPILSPGIFDRDVSDEIALEHSALYESGREGQDLNPRKMAECLLSACAHSLVLFLIPFTAHSGMQLHGAGDYYSFGTAVYTYLIVGGTYRVAYLTKTWNWVSIATIVLTLLGYAFFLVVYGYWKSLAVFMFQVPRHMAGNLPFWLCLVACVLLEMCIDFFSGYILMEFLPSRTDLIQEKALDGTLTAPVEEQAPKAVATSAKRSSTGSSSSSFVFDHPGDKPKHHSAVRNPPNTAGDTSLIDVKPSQVGQPLSNQGGTAKPDPLGKGGKCQPDVKLLSQPFSTASAEGNSVQENRPPNTDFSQQRLPSFQFFLTRKVVVVATGLAGLVVALLGVIALISADSVVEIRIQYAGDAAMKDSHQVACGVTQGSSRSCNIQVIVPEDMKQPIFVEYMLDPFYQNFNAYILSVVNSELEGKTGSSRKICEQFPSAENIGGEKIVPCGLRATSFFNDTFTLQGFNFVTDNIAWQSDVKRFANPSDYDTRPGTSWLYMRYSKSIKRHVGVKDERFVAWMRPAALPTVTNHYGVLKTDLKKGTSIDVRIDSNFPTQSNIKKAVVLTTRGSVGSSRSLGLCLIIVGCACLFVTPLVGIVQLVSPRPFGQQRFFAESSRSTQETE